MATRPLYRSQDAASQARYQELKQLARSQRRVLSGTPGTLKQRTQSGRQYWVREHIHVDGRKTDEYMGSVAAVAPSTVARMRHEIDLAKALAAGSAQLRLFGYQRVDRKPAAVLEVVFNKGLFEAGLALVGSHAYGVLLNELGIAAAGYRTQDVDLARAEPLAIALPEGAGLHSILRETGLDFVPVPGMPSHRPSSSFKLPGADSLAVDLLVPGSRTGQVVAIRELGAHAQAIPLLEFLVEEPQDAVVLSPNQVIPVRVPSPERFLLHKLYASQSRRSTDRDKIRKDLEQAAVLAGAVEDETPGRLVDTLRTLPRGGRTAVQRGALAASRLLSNGHEAAKAALTEIAWR